MNKNISHQENNNNRVIIYLRHGEDVRDKYKYDEKLTEDGKEAARDFAEKLIQEYGVPDVIYCSPYYRTRQTQRQMLKTISKHTDKSIDKIIDPRLSRFFTKDQLRNPDIRKDTMKKQAPIYETFDEFKQRVKEQLDEVEQNNKYKVIWCIGHTLIIKHVAKFKSIKRSHHIDYLDTVIIRTE